MHTSRAIRVFIDLLLAAWVWAAPVAVRAQQAETPAAQEPAPAGQQPPAVFRAGVDSISVDARVTDLQGRPIIDLTAADFEIREGGRVQDITNFKLIRVDDGLDDPAARSAVRTLRDQEREAAREDNRLLAIFLDDYHVRDVNAMRFREQLADFVRTLTPHDLVAIATPTMSMQGLSFSREHEQTAAMILNFEGRKYDYRPRTPFEERYANQLPAVQERMRNDLTLASLQGLCVVLGSLREGRKTLLLVSEGLSGTLPAGVRTMGGPPIPTLPQGPTVDTDVQERRVFLDQAEVLSDMQQVFRAAARANTAIYTIDPRGLLGTEFSVEDSVDMATDRLVHNAALDSLRTIALETDGRSILMKADPLPELRQMIKDASTYYLLGYTSSIAPRDGKFHEIEVRVRRPGVRVSARKGYWAYSEEDVRRAMAPARPTAPPEVVTALEDLAALTARGAGEAALTLWAGARQIAPDKSAVTVVWEAPPSLGRGSRAVVKTVDVEVTSEGGETLFKGPVPAAATGRPAGQTTFDAPPGTMLRVRATAIDGGGEHLDVRDHHLDVPDPAAAPGLRLSTPFVFRGRTALDLREARTAAAPLPTASRTFARSERILVRVQAFAPGGAPPAVTLRLLNSAGQPLATLPAQAAANSPSTYDTELAFGAFPPADYVVEISAAAEQDVVHEYLAIRISG